MALVGTRDGDVVRVGDDARQRFHDARGYGRPLEGNRIALAPVEAAHLLFRGDLAAVEDAGEQLGFREFVGGESDPAFGVRFLVYADLRSRGFYLSPRPGPGGVVGRGGGPDRGDGRDDGPDDATTGPEDSPGTRTDATGERGHADFVVYPRGKGPGDGAIAFRVRAIGERTPVPASEVASGVLAVVDEESEVTYLEWTDESVAGETTIDLPTAVPAELFTDRVVCWEPPAGLYERGFYGQPLGGRDGDRSTLQCSLVEAAYLADRGVLDLDSAVVRERGRAVEGDRFDRRLRVYATLRERGVVPKTGYKFGADFRTYDEVDGVDSLGHSERLVRVLPADHAFEPRDLALDVRLAHGVRKRMTFAIVAGADHPESGEDRDGAGEEPTDVAWWTVERLTP